MSTSCSQLIIVATLNPSSSSAQQGVFTSQRHPMTNISQIPSPTRIFQQVRQELSHSHTQTSQNRPHHSSDDSFSCTFRSCFYRRTKDEEGPAGRRRKSVTPPIVVVSLLFYEWRKTLPYYIALISFTCGSGKNFLTQFWSTSVESIATEFCIHACSWRQCNFQLLLLILVHLFYCN